MSLRGDAILKTTVSSSAGVPQPGAMEVLVSSLCSLLGHRTRSDAASHPGASKLEAGGRSQSHFNRSAGRDAYHHCAHLGLTHIVRELTDRSVYTKRFHDYLAALQLVSCFVARPFTLLSQQQSSEIPALP